MIIPSISYASENRTALVIGNSAYPDSPLKNPINDARDVAQTLEKLGFHVILRVDESHLEMEKAVREFGNHLQVSRGIGLFFYAGHGIQVNGRNYLLPIDADIQDQIEVKHKSLDVDLILGKMELAGNDVNLMILDACRNNPYERRFRGLGRGLAQMDAPSGTVIWYATRPGRVAFDGDGRNSPFTHYLLDTLNQEKIKAREVISQVAVAMRKKGINQEPWQEGIWLEDFYFSQITQPQIIDKKPVNRLANRPVVEALSWPKEEKSKSEPKEQLAKVDQSIIKEGQATERKLIGKYPNIMGIYAGDSIFSEICNTTVRKIPVSGEEVITNQIENGEFKIEHSSLTRSTSAFVDFATCHGRGKFIKENTISGKLDCTWPIGNDQINSAVWKFKGKVNSKQKEINLSLGGGAPEGSSRICNLSTKRKIKFLLNRKF